MSDSASPVAIAIAQLVSRQHGIIDLPGLLKLGMSKSTIAHWARIGRLHRLHRGVYSVIPPALLTLEGRWLAAVRACGPGAVLSCGSAAQLLWLVDRREKLGIHVSLTDRSKRQPDGVIVHRPRELPRCDLTVRSGIPVTSATRTVWDVASTMPTDLAGRAFRKADGWDRLDRARLLSLISRRRTIAAAESYVSCWPPRWCRSRPLDPGWRNSCCWSARSIRCRRRQ